MYKTEDRRMLMIALALALGALAVALVGLSGPSDATITGTPPPASGDWVVDNETTVVGETVLLRGNLFVNATLELDASTININCPSAGAYTVQVNVTGRLVATGSTIARVTAGKGYGFVVLGEMYLDGCLLNGPDSGVRVLTAAPVSIASTVISDFRLGGLYLLGADGTVVRGLSLVSSRWASTMDISADVYDTGTVNVPAVPPSAPLMVDGGSPDIDGVDISVNGTFSITGTLNFYSTAYCNYQLAICFPQVLVEGGRMGALAHVTSRDSVINYVAYYVFNLKVDIGTSRHYIINNYYLDSILVHNPGTFGLDGISVANVRIGTTTLTLSQPSTVVSSNQVTQGVYGLMAVLGGTYADSEVHTSALSVSNGDFFRASAVFVDMLSRCTNTVVSRVTTSLAVSSIRVRESAYQGGVRVENNMLWKKLLQLRCDVGVRDSTFASNTHISVVITLSGSAVSVTSLTSAGTTMPQQMLWDNLTFDGCTWSTNYREDIQIMTSGGGGVSNVDSAAKASGGAGVVDIFELIAVRDCSVSHQDVLNPVIRVTGSGAKHNGTERMVILRNNISDCKSSNAGNYMLTITEKDVVEISNNTFSNLVETNLLAYTQSGGDIKGPVRGDVHIVWNTFSGCKFTSTSETYWGELNVRKFGGDMEVAHNTVTGDSSAEFLNFADSSQYSGPSNLSFHDNSFTDSPNLLGVLYLYAFDAYHGLLDVTVENNVMRDCGRATFIDFYDQGTYAPQLDLNDYDATIIVRGNTVEGAAWHVVRAHGAVSVLDNTFTSCHGYVLYLAFLNLHLPIITGNTYVDCTDILFMGAKAKALGGLPVTIDNLQLDCPGNAVHFSNMQVTLNSPVLTARTNPAVIAENSIVSIVGGSVEVGSGAIIGTGSIVRYHSFEAKVTWADASGTDRGVAAAGVPVVLLDAAGGLVLTRSTDSVGHLGSLQVPAWSIRSTFLTVRTPHTLLIGTAGIAEKVQVTFDRDYLGPNALAISLKDDQVPVVRITSLSEGEFVTTQGIMVAGFVVEMGSGVGSASLTYGGGTPIPLVVDAAGSFSHPMGLVPEGAADVVVTVKDVAGNSNSTTVRIVVDRTAPHITATVQEGAITNLPAVHLVVETEDGATVTIGGVLYPLSGGIATADWTLQEGQNEMAITSTDAAGNTASATAKVLRDSIAPVLIVTAPDDDALFDAGSVSVSGTTEPGVDAWLLVMRGGEEVSNTTLGQGASGAFELTVTLIEGQSTLVLRARDAASNLAEATRTVTVDLTPPAASIDSPSAGALLRSGTVVVTGTVEAGSVATLNGLRLPDGTTFSRALSLGEGAGAIVLVAVDAAGNQETVTVGVVVDSVPPVIDITAPLEPLTITGDVEVSGKVLLGPATLTVGGSPVDVASDGAFTTTVHLTQSGPAQVPLVATDAASNTATVTLDLLADLAKPTVSATVATDAGAGVSQNGTALLRVTVGPTVDSLVVVRTGPSGQRTEAYRVSPGSTVALAVGLEMGDNSIVVHASDANGATEQSPPIAVERVAPPAPPKDEEAGTGPRDAAWVLLPLGVALLVVAVAYVAVRGRKS